MKRQAKAPVRPMRQTTQYNCMSASMSMCLEALGVAPEECNVSAVNKVMGARPMQGASWEQALACAQHYGCRATLTMPSTVQQLKEWTDRGIPVMIAWNPEGRPWSHASVVFDVDNELNVHVADPNIPDPDETVRVVPKAEFYSKWSEKWPDYMVRRPACAIEREITEDGKQIPPTAVKQAFRGSIMARNAKKKKKKKQRSQSKPTKPTLQDKKDEAGKIRGKAPTNRNDVVRDLIQRGQGGAGGHKDKANKGQGGKGKGKAQRHPKHKGKGHEAAMFELERLACGVGDGPCACGGNCTCGKKAMAELEKLAARPHGRHPLLDGRGKYDEDGYKNRESIPRGPSQSTRSLSELRENALRGYKKTKALNKKTKAFNNMTLYRVFDAYMKNNWDGAAEQFSRLDTKTKKKVPDWVLAEIDEWIDDGDKRLRRASDALPPGFEGFGFDDDDDEPATPLDTELRWALEKKLGEKGQGLTAAPMFSGNVSSLIGDRVFYYSRSRAWFVYIDAPASQAVAKAKRAQKKLRGGRTVKHDQYILRNRTMYVGSNDGKTTKVDPIFLDDGKGGYRRAAMDELEKLAGKLDFEVEGLPEEIAKALRRMTPRLLDGDVTRGVFRAVLLGPNRRDYDDYSRYDELDEYGESTGYNSERDNAEGREREGYTKTLTQLLRPWARDIADIGVSAGDKNGWSVYVRFKPGKLERMAGLSTNTLTAGADDLQRPASPQHSTRSSANTQPQAETGGNPMSTIDKKLAALNALACGCGGGSDAVMGMDELGSKEDPTEHMDADGKKKWFEHYGKPPGREARAWSSEDRLLTALGAVADSVSHMSQLARENPSAQRSSLAALGHLKKGEQIMGRDVARDLSLPGYRSAMKALQCLAGKSAAITTGSGSVPAIGAVVTAVSDHTTDPFGVADVTFDSGQTMPVHITAAKREVLRSTNFPPDLYSGTKLFLEFDDKAGQYIVRSRFQNYHQSKKGLEPDSPKARKALDVATKKFESLIRGKKATRPDDNREADWDAGKRTPDQHEEPEGSDVPGLSDDKRASDKTAAGFDLWAILQGDTLVGATDNERNALRMASSGNGQVVELLSVPEHLAMALVDLGTPAATMDGKAAWKQAKRFSDHNGRMAAEREPLESAYFGKEADSTGNYGFTKKLQADCTAASNRIGKAAGTIARKMYAKDARVAEFWATHGKRAKSLPAKVLSAALQDLVPKTASGEIDSVRIAALQDKRDGAALRLAAKDDKLTPASLLKFMGEGHGDITASELRYAFEGTTSQGITKMLTKMVADGKLIKDGRKYNLPSQGKKARYAMYGYASKTSKLGLSGVSDLRQESGRIASTLHTRRSAKHARISEYLKTHCKEAGCHNSRLLMDAYPDADRRMPAEAAPDSVEAWLAWDD